MVLHILYCGEGGSGGAMVLGKLHVVPFGG